MKGGLFGFLSAIWAPPERYDVKPATSGYHAVTVTSALQEHLDQTLQSEYYRTLLHGGPRWRHVKRRTTYTEICRAELQGGRPIVEGEHVVIYLGEDGKYWARQEDEFEAGSRSCRDAAVGEEGVQVDDAGAAGGRVSVSTYWLIVPLVGIGLTIPAWLWLTRRLQRLVDRRQVVVRDEKHQ